MVKSGEKILAICLSLLIFASGVVSTTASSNIKAKEIDTTAAENLPDKEIANDEEEKDGETEKTKEETETPDKGEEIEESEISNLAIEVAGKENEINDNNRGFAPEKTSKNAGLKGGNVEIGGNDDNVVPCLNNGKYHFFPKNANDLVGLYVLVAGNVYKCKNCKKEFNILGPGKTVEAKCEENGYVSYRCNEIGNATEKVKFIYIMLPKLEHDFGEYTMTKEPTCIEKGEKKRTCTRTGCNKTETEEIQINPENHANYDTYLNEVVITEATCTEDGSYDEVTYCAECKKELSRKEKTTNALGHSWQGSWVFNVLTGGWVFEKEWEVKTPATCENNRVESITCLRPNCGYTEEREIPNTALGHDLSEATEKEPTCTESGTKKISCNRCDYSATEEILAKGHTPGDPVKENEVAATCTAPGSYDEVIYCTTCNSVISREKKTINAQGHKFGEYKITKEPTCIESGEKERTCTRTGCNKTETEEIQALGHIEGDPVIENKKPATCTRPGMYENVYYCTRVIGEDADGHNIVCGQEISREKITIAALGHTPGETVIENTVEPTCTAAGSYDEVIYCTGCNSVISRETGEIPATGHTPGEPVKENEVAATCTAPGSYDEVVYCKTCHKQISREIKNIEALGHIEGEPVIENEVKPTAEEPGHYDVVIYCERCNKELSRETVTTDVLSKEESEVVSEKPAEIQEISAVKVEEAEEISNAKPTGEELLYENLALLAMLVSSFGAIFIAVRHMNKRKEN